jgi:flagella basal body P-ring formation protein FlgA
MLTRIGKGFKVSAEGQSMSNATVGQLVKVKIASGQVLTGIARNDGLIEVVY